MKFASTPIRHALERLSKAMEALDSSDTQSLSPEELKARIAEVNAAGRETNKLTRQLKKNTEPPPQKRLRKKRGSQ